MRQWFRGVAALAVVGGLAGGVALARGPDLNLPMFGAVAPSYSNPSYENPPFQSFFSPGEQPDGARSRDAEPERRKAKHRSVAAYGHGKAVCVRLCDGSFFPAPSVSGGEAACAAQCPDAPTALYTMASDRIEDAVSSTGKPYSALPVAKRFETSYENTCTCHRDAGASRAKELLRDQTLRKGDVVMTADGFQVYQGDGYGPTGPKDFVALAHAHVPSEERAALLAMERTSSGSPAPARPSLFAARLKGNVTVDSGTAMAQP